MRKTMINDLDIQQLVRDNIRTMVPYSSARDEFSGTAAVYLDANENPHNHPLNRYPDPRQKALKERIAHLKGQEPERLFLGNGSDEGIDLLFRILCNPGLDNVVTVDPTYGMYGVCAQVNDIRCKSVLLNPDFSLDPARVLEAVDESTKMIFLCSPNNPTGNSMHREALLDIIDRAPCMVVIDEAYADFSPGTDLLSLVPQKPNLVILQTLSKAWGLAGIRLGMVFAHPVLIHYLGSVKYPYNVNGLTIRAAMEALSKPERKKEWVREILRERVRLAGSLASFRFIEKIHPSDANFLLVRTDNPEKIYEFLVDREVIVRDRSSVPLCEGCLRITVGTSRENDKLLEALGDYEQENQNQEP